MARSRCCLSCRLNLSLAVSLAGSSLEVVPELLFDSSCFILSSWIPSCLTTAHSEEEGLTSLASLSRHWHQVFLISAAAAEAAQVLPPRWHAVPSSRDLRDERVVRKGVPARET